ncbi:MAG: hypothetical protein ACK5HT_17825, partial [Draconibacterium sp.]
MKSIPLLPNRYRKVAYVLLVLGVVSGYFYFFGGKPDVFVTRIFTLVTSYVDTRYFVNAQTNLLDEVAALFLIAGFSILAFSKEKIEEDEINFLRLKAFIVAAYFTLIIWILIFLFIYGWAIFLFSSAVFLIFLLLIGFLFC